MKKKLDETLTHALQVRLYVIRTLRVLKIGELSENWGLSKATLLRYDSPSYREASRRSVINRNNKERLRDKTKCQICLKLLAGHDRCEYCTILVHGEPECSCIALKHLKNIYFTHES